METNDMTSWMLGEHGKIRELNDELRAAVTTPPRGNREEWLAGVVKRIDEYVSRMREHMLKEEEGGYLTHVIELRPTLADSVDVLKYEHDELNALMDDVQAAVKELSPTDNLLLRDCCRRIEHLMTWMDRHEEHENHIMIYAFTQDIGAAD